LRGSLTNPSGVPTTVSSIVLFDVFPPSDSAEFDFLKDSRIHVVTGNITDKKTVDSLFIGSKGQVSIFHLASIMSGEGELNFDKCLSVNLDGARLLLESARHLNTRPRFIFLSSTTVYPPQQGVSDTTKLLPLTTYGTTKAICELLVNDYTRKGFINGRTARLPTVVVRPGRPNAATTGCYSGAVREPFNGEKVILPLHPKLLHPIIGVRTLITGLIKLHEAPDELVAQVLGHDRAIQMPSLTITLEEVVESVKQVAPKLGIKKVDIEWQLDEKLNNIVASFANSTDASRALKLGLPSNPSFQQMVLEYVEDFLPKDKGIKSNL